MSPTAHALAVLTAIVLGNISASAQPASPSKPAAPSYGASAEHGHYVAVNGIKLYYESHGSGPVMLQIHGNSGSIADLTPLIGHFAKNHRVLVADSRGHGKSEFGKEPLTYERMAEDLNALLDHVGAQAVSVLGLSDGGILGLLLAMHHPDKVGKLVVAGANLVRLPRFSGHRHPR
ncbi:MAG: alpha/beta hydrolase [Opitutaceae bacterium]|nr:alpha/beta hydrolase [Opitutaceae bacterium]